MSSTAGIVSRTLLNRYWPATSPQSGTESTAPDPRPAVTTPRDAVLEGWRSRNALLDGVFYDVGVITEAEAKALAPWLATEGTLLHVPPSGKGEVSIAENLDDLAAVGGKGLPGAVAALAVAGVGSSALGAAAFARNVADGLGSPVVAVVSGYGLADLAAEALGGWFFFGSLNKLRHGFEGLDRQSPATASSQAAAATTESVAAAAATSSDTLVTAALLGDRRFDLQFLAGHSKGNLVIAEALENPKAASLPADTRIVTFSATIGMPARFTRIYDVMGGVDGFRLMNSLWGRKVERWVPFAWHHTNTEAWGPIRPIDVEAEMRRIAALP